MDINKNFLRWHFDVDNRFLKEQRGEYKDADIAGRMATEILSAKKYDETTKKKTEYITTIHGGAFIFNFEDLNNLIADVSERAIREKQIIILNSEKYDIKEIYK